MKKFKNTLTSRKDKWLQKIESQGYSRTSYRMNRKTILKFIETYETSYPFSTKPTLQQLRDLIELTIENIPKSKKWAKTILKCFIIYLQEKEGIRDEYQIKLEKTLRYKETSIFSSEYETYLRNLRGLAERSIVNYSEFFRNFIDYKFKGSAPDFKKITRKDCITYLRLRTEAAPRTRGLPGNLRNVLNFLFWAGYIDSNLGNNLPRQRLKHARAIPKYLPKEDIDLLVNSVRDNPKRGNRDYAMLLLMAIAGLRAREVVRVKLSDIYWNDKAMLVRGKGRENELQPLNDKTLSAIRNYIEHDRKGDSEYLFLTVKAPFRKYKDGAYMNHLLKEASLRTGICPPGKYVGSRIFRHSLATDMANKNIPLEFISTYMRHKSKDTTRIYAKLNIEALRSIVPDFPQSGDRS